jgi:hemerythrin-like domain-containing protein
MSVDETIQLKLDDVMVEFGLDHGLWSKLNSGLGLMIDAYEAETIPLEQLERAVELIAEFIDQYHDELDSESLESLMNLVNALRAAAGSGAAVRIAL